MPPQNLKARRGGADDAGEEGQKLIAVVILPVEAAPSMRFIIGAASFWFVPKSDQRNGNAADLRGSAACRWASHAEQVSAYGLDAEPRLERRQGVRPRIDDKMPAAGCSGIRCVRRTTRPNAIAE